MNVVPCGGRFPVFQAGLLSLVIAWSAWHPAEWGVWWMEMSWVLGVFVLLALTYRKFRFSNLAYGLAFLGSQGDVWDAQKDMLCDTLGAIVATVLFVPVQRKIG